MARNFWAHEFSQLNGLRGVVASVAMAGAIEIDAAAREGAAAEPATEEASPTLASFFATVHSNVFVGAAAGATVVDAAALAGWLTDATSCGAVAANFAVVAAITGRVGEAASVGAAVTFGELLDVFASASALSAAGAPDVVDSEGDPADSRFAETASVDESRVAELFASDFIEPEMAELEMAVSEVDCELFGEVSGVFGVFAIFGVLDDVFGFFGEVFGEEPAEDEADPAESDVEEEGLDDSLDLVESLVSEDDFAAADLFGESEPFEPEEADDSEDVEPGLSAHAAPHPTAIAAPMPNATAKPPTLPTYSPALISFPRSFDAPIPRRICCAVKHNG